MAKTYKFTIQLSEFEMRKLICWAKAHGKPKATYAGQIIGARIESNIGTIGEMMTDIAKHEGVSIEDLEQRWLIEEGFSSDAGEEE
jgi:hypothetical protein